MLQTKRLKIIRILTVITAGILMLVPFHAFFTTWFASTTGHYTIWRLWDEGLLVIGIGLVAWILYQQRRLWQAFRNQRLLWLIGGYILLEILMGLLAFMKQEVNFKALGYGLIVNLRFLLFFVVCLVVAAQSGWIKQHWQKLFLVPAVIVVAFGLLQHFVLPYDFLRHFGYSLSTIPPYETINQNLHYIRVISTLRGANPLGAYLIIVVSALSVMIVKQKNNHWRLAYSILLIGSLITLFYSYSRGAWVGAGLSIVLVLASNIKRPQKLRWLAAGLGMVIIIIGLSLFMLRHTSQLQDTIFHTDRSHSAPTTSNEGHASGLKNGLHDVLHQPLGRGPGTAGPASVYNNHPARIAENYFVQVAQEVGWLGLILFILINWLVAKNLWLERHDPLALTLLAALIGITFVNLLSHAWVDDTLSYLWWGLAGVALAHIIAREGESKSHVL